MGKFILWASIALLLAGCASGYAEENPEPEGEIRKILREKIHPFVTIRVFEYEGQKFMAATTPDGVSLIQIQEDEEDR